MTTAASHPGATAAPSAASVLSPPATARERRPATPVIAPRPEPPPVSVAPPAPPPTRWRVPFHLADIDDADVDAVVEVLRSGWLTTGRHCRSFEEAFGTLIGEGRHAVAVNSGTAALHLGLDALGVERGSLVITSPYTFTATAEVIRHVGADPVFADVDPVTGNVTPETVLAAYEALAPRDRRRVQALVPVHFAGLPCAMTDLTALAATHGWRVLDDAAHALPALHDGQLIGAHGDVTAFSFYVTKTLCTGEGGMVVTGDADIARRLRTMRLHGIDRDVFDRYRRADAWYYEVVDAGFKYNLPDTAAALGLAQLAKLWSHRDRRARIAATYHAAFADLPGVVVPPDAPDEDRHAWHLYALRLEDPMCVRDELIRQLAARGIGASVHFIPLHLHPYYRDRYDLRPGSLPAATTLYGSEVSLPIFPAMTDSQIDAVVEELPAALARARTVTGYLGT